MKLSTDSIQNAFMRASVAGIDRSCVASAIAVPVKKILLVGALLDGEGYLSADDQKALNSSLKFLADQKIRLDPSCEIEVANLKYGDEDFLQGRYDADVVIACKIFNPPNKGAGGGTFPGADPSVFSISAKHHDPRIWHDSAARTNAKIICAIGYMHDAYGVRTEITADDFAGKRFCTIDYEDDYLSIAMDRVLAMQLGLKEAPPVFDEPEKPPAHEA